jgi:hypothetical protein
MEVSQTKLDDMLRKVQALLARAEHPNTPVAEAEASRAKAEVLMFKYRIDETLTVQGSTVPGFIPEWRMFPLCDYYSEFQDIYRSMAATVVHHVGCQAVYRAVTVDNGDGTTRYEWQAEVVGYASDLRIVEVLYTACRLAFATKLEPKYDGTKTDQENAYAMRSAGMEGWRIAEAIYGRKDKALRPKVRAMFKAEALRLGEDPTVLLGKGNSVKLFRESFAKGFELEIWRRLNAMRTARGAEETGLVLASREEAIKEAFYDRYPQYRPVKVAGTGTVGYVSPTESCAKCQKAKSGYCREHSYLRPSTRQAPKENYAAYDRGKQAARTADLGPTGTKPKVEGAPATSTPKGLEA